MKRLTTNNDIRCNSEIIAHKSKDTITKTIQGGNNMKKLSVIMIASCLLISGCTSSLKENNQVEEIVELANLDTLKGMSDADIKQLLLDSYWVNERELDYLISLYNTELEDQTQSLTSIYELLFNVEIRGNQLEQDFLSALLNKNYEYAFSIEYNSLSNESLNLLNHVIVNYFSKVEDEVERVEELEKFIQAMLLSEVDYIFSEQSIYLVNAVNVLRAKIESNGLMARKGLVKDDELSKLSEENERLTVGVGVLEMFEVITLGERGYQKPKNIVSTELIDGNGETVIKLFVGVSINDLKHDQLGYSFKFQNTVQSYSQNYIEDSFGRYYEQEGTSQGVREKIGNEEEISIRKASNLEYLLFEYKLDQIFSALKFGRIKQLKLERATRTLDGLWFKGYSVEELMRDELERREFEAIIKYRCDIYGLSQYVNATVTDPENDKRDISILVSIFNGNVYALNQIGKFERGGLYAIYDEALIGHIVDKIGEKYESNVSQYSKELEIFKKIKSNEGFKIQELNQNVLRRVMSDLDQYIEYFIETNEGSLSINGLQGIDETLNERK